MALGSLDDIEFEVSDEKVRTFRDLNLNKSAKFAAHEIHNKKALLEFTGFDADDLSLKIDINSALGVDVKEELDALHDLFNNHEAVPFILNGEPQGEGLWVLESLDEDFSMINNKGELVRVELSLKLKEYLELDGEES